MPARLNWRVGPAGGRPEAFDSGEIAAWGRLDSDTHPAPARRGLRWFVPLYLAILALAAGLGFALGRWSEARAEAWRGIEGQLTLERLARRDGDLGLFEATLDPQSPPAWRRVLVRAFRSGPAGSDGIEIESLEPTAPDRVRVVVRVGSRPGRASEAREYRLFNGDWYRTAPLTP